MANYKEAMIEAIHLAAQRISDNAEKIVNTVDEGMTDLGIDIHFDASGETITAFVPEITVRNTFWGVKQADLGKLVDIYHGEEK